MGAQTAFHNNFTLFLVSLLCDSFSHQHLQHPTRCTSALCYRGCPCQECCKTNKWFFTSCRNDDGRAICSEVFNFHFAHRTHRVRLPSVRGPMTTMMSFSVVRYRCGGNITVGFFADKQMKFLLPFRTTETIFRNWSQWSHFYSHEQWKIFYDNLMYA